MVATSKEEYGIILDFLPHGYPFDKTPLHRRNPLALAVGKTHFSLLELAPKKGCFLQPYEEVYIGEGKRDKIHHTVGKIPLAKLTQTARKELDFVITELVKNNPQPFLDFFNHAGPINTRRHQIELLPGIGKKHLIELLEARQQQPFASFEDIRQRVKLLPDPEKIIVKRIIAEYEETDKYKLFVR